jgi:hypothetical protein
MSKLSFSPNKFGSARKSSANAGEPVTIKVFTNQVVEACIPFSTPRAGEIRTTIRSLRYPPDSDNSAMMLIFHEDMGEPPKPSWNTVQRDGENVTSPPYEAASLLHEALSKCPAVSTVSLLDGADNAISLQDVKAMQFDSWESPPAPDLPGGVADADMMGRLMEGVGYMHTQMDTLTTDMGRKQQDVLDTVKVLVEKQLEIEMKLGHLHALLSSDPPVKADNTSTDVTTTTVGFSDSSNALLSPKQTADIAGPSRLPSAGPSNTSSAKRMKFAPRAK